MKKNIVVFTCGCYDLFHAGHLKTLEEAKRLGNYLIVGISSDKVIRDSKGPNRPIISQKKRVKIISSIEHVDEIIVGNNNNFVDFIIKRKPDIYLKGGDYNINSINQEERKAVESYGGKIYFTKYIKGSSTTKIVNKIKNKK